MSINTPSLGSVTGWIEELKDRDPDAQRKIWERFVNRLVRFANRKLNDGRYCLGVDADDIANMAFANFYKSPDQFRKLVNRNDLWKILTMLAERRIIDEIRHTNALRHGGGNVVGETSVGNSDDSQSIGMDCLAGPTQPPDFDVLLAEEFERRLESLGDDELRRVAIERMQGYKNREIAKRLEISIRSVERKMKEIRDIFANASA